MSIRTVGWPGSHRAPTYLAGGNRARPVDWSLTE